MYSNCGYCITQCETWIMGRLPVLVTVFGVFNIFNILSGSNACWLRTKKICCEDIETGFCFQNNDILLASPKCPSKFSPTFRLFTRNNSKNGVLFSKETIPKDFTNSRRTIFIVHGWRAAFGGDYHTLKTKLLEKDDANVIAVDWRYGSTGYTYFPAAANSQSTGALIGALTNKLRSQAGSKPYFWCIGHSLGAHVCGYTKLTAKPLLDRITGSDPAGPGFLRHHGLTKKSALKVDVLHTDPIFGTGFPRGHVDFYPNGGKDQPGCTPIEDLLKKYAKILGTPNGTINLMQSQIEFGCSHQKSFTYLMMSVISPTCFTANYVCQNHYNFTAKSCTKLTSRKDQGWMGYDAANHRYDGILYFKTEKYYPYCTDFRSAQPNINLTAYLFS